MEDFKAILLRMALLCYFKKKLSLFQLNSE